MIALIVSGSPDLDIDLVRKLEGDYVIGVDYGAYRLVKGGLKMDIAVGDFDSIDEKALAEIKKNCSTIYTFDAIKNETDTELAIRKALELGVTRIKLLGATGRRIDHFLGSLNLFYSLVKKGVDLEIIDSCNRITLLTPGVTQIKKGEYHYLSLFSYRGSVENLSLKGFKYPLHHHLLQNDDSLTISNEILGEEGEISFTKGYLLVVESSD